MPPKTKRQRQNEKSLEKAREAKRRRAEGKCGDIPTETTSIIHDSELGESRDFSDLLAISGDALDTEDEERDNYNVKSSTKEALGNFTDTFCEDWLASLDRKNLVSLGVFLCFKLRKVLEIGETRAAEVAGTMIGKSDRTVREWKSSFLQNGEIPESRRGKYPRSGVLWTNEHLNTKARDFIRGSTGMDGKSNLTVGQFCQWVNDELLPNNAETFEPELSLRKISSETARTWMHKLGHKF